MDKDKMFVAMNKNSQLDLSLNEIIGSDEHIAVESANGTVKSIIDWTTKCKLDQEQKRAFEIITGYYILSYIYSIYDLDEDGDTMSQFILTEKVKLLILIVLISLVRSI